MNQNQQYELGTCQNCGSVLDDTTRRAGKMFCSEKCQQTASVVRYGRSSKRDGRYYTNPDVREAIRIQINQIISGGYPEQARRLLPQQREFIFQRDGRVCTCTESHLNGPYHEGRCEAEATTIDHISGSSSDQSNLRAMCKPCNMARFYDHAKPAGPEQQAEANAIRERINAEQPTRLCDDDQNWATVWRDMSRRQKTM
jgi:hypothetical protein